jgi:hypothetical protein
MERVTFLGGISILLGGTFDLLGGNGDFPWWNFRFASRAQGLAW